MSNNTLIIKRILQFKSSLNEAKVKKEPLPKKKEELKEDEKKLSSSKIVYAYMGKKLIGEYDSITKCGIALGLTRLMVRKAIENNVELESGLKLSLTKK